MSTETCSTGHISFVARLRPGGDSWPVPQRQHFVAMKVTQQARSKMADVATIWATRAPPVPANRITIGFVREFVATFRCFRVRRVRNPCDNRPELLNRDGWLELRRLIALHV